MADVNAGVLEMVEKELERDSGASTSDLFELAKRIDPEMKELSIRQFHAKYPLQVKRKTAMAKGGGTRRKKRRRTSSPSSPSSAASSSSGSSTADSSADSDSDSSRGRRRRRSKGVDASTREAIRGELMAFAQDLSSATSDPATLVRVLANVDQYVDRVINAGR